MSGGNIVVEAEAGQTTTMQVVDMLGRVVRSTVIAEGVHTMPAGGLAEGIYIIRLSNSKGAKAQKIVVR